MFDRDQDRYLTRGVKAEIPPVTQLLLWGLIEELGETHSLDYLQVFELSPENRGGVTWQGVAHKQERSPYSGKHLFRPPEAVKAKIFVIDDGDHSTMLLAEEY